MNKDELVEKFRPLVEITYYYTPELTEFYANKCATIAQEYAREMNTKFDEWKYDKWNPFIRLDNSRWVQTCGNGTSWSNDELYNLYLESLK